MFKRKLSGRPRSAAFRFLEDVSRQKTDDCVFFPFSQKAVAWGGTSKSPHWISCYLAHGPRPEGMVPVRICGVVGCINGLHFKWGTQDEAQKARVFRSRVGGKNPNARVNEEIVAEWRGRNWGNGMGKRAAADEAGITVKTLASILDGRSWTNVSSWALTPVGRTALALAKSENKGDEF